MEKISNDSDRLGQMYPDRCKAIDDKMQEARDKVTSFQTLNNDDLSGKP